MKFWMMLSSRIRQKIVERIVEKLSNTVEKSMFFDANLPFDVGGQ